MISVSEAGTEPEEQVKWNFLQFISGNSVPFLGLQVHQEVVQRLHFDSLLLVTP